MASILIVEDEKAISDLIKLNLDVAGYHSVQAFSGQEAITALGQQTFDLVLLDIMLPGLSGLDILPKITKRKIPVILVTARDSLKDKVTGLESGADDYITKPFEGTELVARVKALLRRRGKEEESTSFADIRIEYDSRRVFKNEAELELTLKEFELLKCFIDRRNIAVSREELLETVWGYDFPGNTRTVDIHVQKLRAKLGTHRIKTVYKMGYRMEL
ncbi:MAG TPA: response regulator transcription factor [Spirochaetia bacterium]|nr:response regulator transcription factor [Spirochaetia bacterium]